MCIDMDLNNATRHFFSVEMSNSERLETASMMDALKESGIIPYNMNMGHFIRECFARGLNDYRKELNRHD